MAEDARQRISELQHRGRNMGERTCLYCRMAEGQQAIGKEQLSEDGHGLCLPRAHQPGEERGFTQRMGRNEPHIQRAVLRLPVCQPKERDGFH